MFSSVSNDEAVRAHKARLALVGEALYPSWPLEGDEGFAVLEQGQRAELPCLLDRLSRSDLFALYQLVQLLALNPRDDDEVFAAVVRQDAWVREVMGVEEAEAEITF